LSGKERSLSVDTISDLEIMRNKSENNSNIRKGLTSHSLWVTLTDLTVLHEYPWKGGARGS